MAGHYEKMVDRESAYEILNKKAAPDAPKVDQSAEARRAEFERQRAEHEAAKNAPAKTPARRTDSLLHGVLQIGRALGRLRFRADDRTRGPWLDPRRNEATPLIILLFGLPPCPFLSLPSPAA